MNIKETNLEFNSLSERGKTDMIVIHHTGENDIDASAEQIHGWHLNNGWAGIGYHYVIRKDGTIERGRPEWAVGSHAYGENSHTLGIHISGDFMKAKPTAAQIASCAALIGDICTRYGIPKDRAHIVGHGELMATSCPGVNLQALIDSGELIHGGTSTNKETNPTEKKTWQFLKDKGFNDFATAGIMGNLYAESGLSPINLENYYESKLGMSDQEYTAAVDNGSYTNFVHDKAGYGLAQWTYYTRKQGLLEAAKAAGKSIGDIDLQLEYLWSEFQGYRAMLETLKTAENILQASNAVLLDFERPANQSELVQRKRAELSQRFFDAYANKEDEKMEKRYNTLEEVPAWGKETIKSYMDKKILNGDGGGLDLSLDMIRQAVIFERRLENLGLIQGGKA